MDGVTAGRFRTPIVIERIKGDAEAGPDGHIDLTDSANWMVFDRCRAELIRVTMRESLYSQQVVAAGTVRVTVRRGTRTSQVTTRDRIRAEGKLMEISEMIEVGSPSRLIEFVCTEVQ